MDGRISGLCEAETRLADGECPVEDMQVSEEYIPFGRPNFSEEEIEQVSRQLRSGWVGMGSETLTFEEELARYLECNHVVTVNSCTSALFLSLVAEGIEAGDEVICPSFTWCSTANVAMYLGAKPVFCDIEADTLCPSNQQILDKVTPSTKAVIIVHMGGYAMDVSSLRRALPKRIAIIEDAAHALGSRYPDGSPVGSSGNLTCFSFYANKNLSTGEGGAIAVNNKEIARGLRSRRLHCLPDDAWERFRNPNVYIKMNLAELGYKHNFTDLQSAIGRVQLRRQNEFAEKRLQIAATYHCLLSAELPQILLQREILDSRHARHLFTIQLPLEEINLSRDDVVQELRKMNVGATIHYAPLHVMPLYGPPRDTLPNTETIADRIITLPISASITDQEAHYVAEQVYNVIEDNR